MTNKRTPRIVQIMPADNWWYRDAVNRSWLPLAAWVLVERDHDDGRPPERTVQGFDPLSKEPNGLVRSSEFSRSQGLAAPPAPKPRVALPPNREGAA